MPDKKGRFNAQERKFVEHYAATGHAAFSAAKAGYRTPDARASQNLAKPAIVEAIKREQVARLNNEALPLAIQVLLDVMTSKTSTERGKLAATALVLKHTVGLSIETGEKEPHEMSADELQQRIGALRHEAAERAVPIIEGEILEQPEPGVFG